MRLAKPLPRFLFPVFGVLTCGTALAQEAVVTIPALQVLDTRPAGAFAAATLSDLGNARPLTSPYDATSLAPNLFLSNAGTTQLGSLVSVRGLSNTPYFGEPSLAWYIDDLPLGSVAAAPSIIPGLDSVLWVRGPQATFSFGRSAPGGVARFQTLTSGNKVSVSYGSRNATRAEAQTVFRSGKMDTGAALAWQRADGHVTNTTLGETVGDIDHRGVNTRVRWTPNSRYDVGLQILGSQSRDGAQPLVPLSTPGYTVQRPQEGVTESDFLGAVLTARGSGEFGTISTHTSLTDWKLAPYRTAFVLPPLFTSDLGQKQRIYAQELRWQSPDSAGYPSAFGLWYSDGKTDGQVSRSVFGTIPVEASSFQLRRQTWAAFAQSVLMSDEGWTLEGGLRAERQKTEFGRIEEVPNQGGYRVVRTKTRYTPKLAATVPISKTSRLLLIAAEAYKPEGYSAYTDNKRLAGFSAERTRAAEAVWEWTPTNTFALNARAFRYDIRNYQIERSFTPTDYLVVNAPRARSTGYEVEAKATLIEWLRVEASGGWQEVTLRQFTDPFSGQVLDGKRAPYAPRFTTRLQTDITLARGLVFSAEARRIGGITYTESEDPLYFEPGYTLLNGSIAWERGRWTLIGRLSNATDKFYRSVLVPGVDHAIPGEPRTWTIELRYRF